MSKYKKLIEQFTLYEIATIASMDNYKYVVRGETEKNKHKPPHLHVLDKSSDKRDKRGDYPTIFKVIIKDGDLKSFKDIEGFNMDINNRDKKVIYNFLKMPDKHKIHKTNWDRAKHLWQAENEHAKKQFKDIKRV